MILDLRGYEQFPVRVALDAGEGSFEPFQDDVTSVGPVRVQLTIHKSAEEYFLHGTVAASVTLLCSRCAREFESQVDGPIDFIARSASTRNAGKERPVVDDEDYAYFPGHDPIVDIADLVRQSLVLSVGMKPLCDDACKGLCPRCGKNLNEGQCGCSETRGDGRWEPLGGLLNEQ